MNIKIKPCTPEGLLHRACDMTRPPGVIPSTMSLKGIYKCEHSPIRTITFWVELLGIPSFVSTHLVRHKHGVEHFVQSMRSDNTGVADTETNRLTPVNHGMYLNAQAVIQMSRKRLCYKSHRMTVSIWTRVRKVMRKVDPDLADKMVPECVYRNGYCPELKACPLGADRVLRIYKAQA